jgi:hypothetical protein
MILASFKRSTRSPSKRLAISALAVAVVLFVVIGIAVELTFLPKASVPSSGQTTTAAAGCKAAGGGSGSSPSAPVKSAVDQQVKYFNSRDVAGLSNFYTPDACVNWSGLATGLVGTYTGQNNIKILYGSSIGKTTSLNASIANYNEKATSPTNVNVTMTINMKGNSSVVGALDANIAATQQWTYSGQQWQIVKENWDYKTFIVLYPVSSTTFPQWAALRAGQNPNLVSEKSFEWNVGPFVAVSVYAFLGGVLAIGLMKYRRRSSP